MLTPLDIARIEERRQAIGTADVSSESEPFAGGTMCFSGVGSWSNQASGAGLEGEVSGEEIDRFVAFYESRGVEPRIELCPFAHDTLVAGLESRGFLVREFENVLARELFPGDDYRALPLGWPEGVEVRAIDADNADEIERYVRLTMSGFIDIDAAPESFLEPVRRSVRHPRCDAFIAWLGDEPVGGGTMESDEAAAFFGASVRPEYRRRGVQQALISARLERARERGSRIACIHSKPGIPTERNAIRLGFAMAYTKAIMVRPGEGLARSI